MEASLIVSLRVVEMPIFAKRPEVRSHSNHKVKNLFMLSVRISSYGCMKLGSSSLVSSVFLREGNCTAA